MVGITHLNDREIRRVEQVDLVILDIGIKV